ncbi:MAG: hypothetical protein LBG96_11085 [Tannerella sp.]|nr:hypothetical protein [Tannerella sp.]
MISFLLISVVLIAQRPSGTNNETSSSDQSGFPENSIVAVEHVLSQE